MVAGPTDRVAGYLEALQQMLPLVAEHRAAFDQIRRLPPPVFEALADAGLFRLWLPRSLGGPELSPLEFMSVVEAASAIDGSIGWLVGNGGGMSRAGGYLPVNVASRWFEDQRSFITSATGGVGSATPTDGDFRVSGRWPFGSGSYHATHFMGLVAIKADDGCDLPPICCYFPRAVVEVHDTWHVTGLRGTGSCDFEVQNILVPADHTHPFFKATPSQPGVVYSMPPANMFPWTVSVVPLGIAMGAIFSFKEIVASKTRQGTSALLRDRETVQSTVGRAEALHQAGRAFLIQAMTELLESFASGVESSLETRARYRLACTYAAETATRIVRMLATQAGAAAIFETCELERKLRDVQAAAQHVAMSPNNYVVAGRVGLGLDPGTSRL